MYVIYALLIFCPKIVFDHKILIDWQNCWDKFNYPGSIVYLSYCRCETCPLLNILPFLNVVTLCQLSQRHIFWVSPLLRSFRLIFLLALQFWFRIIILYYAKWLSLISHFRDLLSQFIAILKGILQISCKIKGKMMMKKVCLNDITIWHGLS